MENNDRFIKIDEVESMIGLSQSRVYAMVKGGDFPKPVKLGKASRWSLSAIRKWMAAQIEAAA
ncbi:MULTISPECIES: helix-turn-helix transcriptional regulator [Rhizobium/Agrobacterium group]|uniref:AlpA family phage regulatory protein n=1 Tax=Rhizobium rhizogenes TaxID=359 RepID=A0AA88F2K7_RHIRH|nr:MULTISPECIES: AlpA family phage regulatory protein [Rhizobium/Agrobacterium group]KAA3502584.1 AlpA family phage regulatory protein [Rhizobium rhizogenes]CDN91993.1 putative transcriptional regulator [Agrobacterium tumefaciens]